MQSSRKQKVGVCHRCGWSGPVQRVTRSIRSELHIGHQYGRLCADCMHDLAVGRSAPDHPVTRHKVSALKSRNVA